MTNVTATNVQSAAFSWTKFTLGRAEYEYPSKNGNKFVIYHWTYAQTVYSLC